MSKNVETMLKLQNGSDVRGIATEGVKGESINLTPDAANQIAQAFVLWLSGKLSKPADQIAVGVGCDSRISGPELKAAILKGVSAAGSSVTDCGLATTPGMFMSIVFPESHFDGSIMITASHLPFNRNGMKFFDADGGLEHDDITAILNTAADLEVQTADLSNVPSFALIDVYARHLSDTIRSSVQADDYEHPLSGLKIVVDAGNGAGGFFVDKILKPLGADAGGSQFLEPDGMFPNHIPNPENKAAMEAIRSATVDHGADLGLIFDTDVDRMSAVLPDGTEVNRDAIIAMVAAILAPEYPGGTIVTDSVTSHRLTYFLEEILHMKHHCFKRGYKNVINECKRLNGEGILSPLAMETSGHGALKENYYLDDGAFLAVKLLIAVARSAREGKKIASLIEKLPPLFEDREYRFKIRTDDFKTYGQTVLQAFEERAKAKGYHLPKSYEGVRISFDNDQIKGWVLLRLSLHDPVMPLNIEGSREGDCDRLVEITRQLLEGFELLDMTVLD
ncbi:phosphomannomutase/phosphoglucomutase [Diplocloster hominis]|uniref:phosphomannomutase/phosphoglucomutase n=1 Tax=Diplocloster hominis TaxID=3079010 RepID=UPI0031BB07F4